MGVKVVQSPFKKDQILISTLREPSDVCGSSVRLVLPSPPLCTHTRGNNPQLENVGGGEGEGGGSRGG